LIFVDLEFIVLFKIEINTVPVANKNNS